MKKTNPKILKKSGRATTRTPAAKALPSEDKYRPSVDVHWENVPASELGTVGLSLKNLNKLFREFIKHISHEAEWTSAVSILGARPQHLSILFCDDVRMRQFNREYRNLDRTTDILSFPAIEMLAEHSLEPNLSLGDIVVSLAAVRRGARRGRRSDADELIEVLIHGFLHLLGFDHVLGKKVGQKKADRMRNLQRSLYLRIRPTIK